MEISPEARRAAGEAAGQAQLTEQERREVQDLKQRDRETRGHEQAHKAAGGAHAGSISLSFTTGPDGKRYATGGEVPIDTSPEKDPRATIAKMQRVRQAALAPSNPSAADRQVAARAAKAEREARNELERGRLVDVVA